MSNETMNAAMEQNEAATKKPRKKKEKRITGVMVAKTILQISISIFVNFFIVMLLSYGYNYGFEFTNSIFSEIPYKVGDDTQVVVTIPADSSSMEIIDIVVEADLVRDKYVFIVKTYLEEYYKNFKPGTYQLSPGMTNSEILQTLTGQVPEE